MNRYLLEVGVEEFPSRYIKNTKEQFIDQFQRLCRDNGLAVSSLRIESTPRRFAIWLEDLQPVDTASEEVLRGPAKRIAYDAQGNPTKALEGFMRSKKVSEQDLFIQMQGKEEYVFARVAKEALDLPSLLQEIVPKVIRSISNPRSMRWGGKNLQFLRPIRWILSLYNDEVLPFALEGIPVGNETRGHRFLGKSPIVVQSIDAYESQLEDNGVILDEEKRRSIILRGLNRLAREKGGKPLLDEELLDEVVCIVEYPTVFVGQIPAQYLALPQEVVITPMKDHQRYFPLLDEQKHLLPYFLSVRNGDEKGLENVIAGNERVLVPRLEDARFFFTQDRSQTLEERLPKLETLNFHDKLGTMADKTRRLEELVVPLGEKMQCADTSIEHTVRAAHLSKADLVTQMVVEFTELQGVVGRIYASLEGEPQSVAQAIEEQYRPIAAGAALPESTSGMILALADKIDTIAGLFAAGVEVSGSQDPFGLRRAAIGILDILLQSKLHLDLEDAFREALLLYVNQQSLVFDYDEVIAKIQNFFRGRLRTKLLSMGIRYDVIDSVIDSSDSDLVRVVKKAKAVQAFLEEANEEAFNGFVRVVSLAKKQETQDYDREALQEEDHVLVEIVEQSEAWMQPIAQNHYKQALDALAERMPKIHEYLDHTMILVENAALREARLGLLGEMAESIHLLFNPEAIVKE